MRTRSDLEVRIGISGWNYKGWRGVFYPLALAQRRELEFASRQFNSIEINGSFYSLQRPSSYQRWYDETPADFVFSIKGGRFITHMKRLRDVEIPLANFFASGVLALREKLGPILWQFPPMFHWNAEKFRTFFQRLPRNTVEAAELAKRHDQKLKARAWAKTDKSRRIRYAIEIRHDSFIAPEFFKLLRRHRAAFVFSDAAAGWPYAEKLTADFVYCRLHGAEKLYTSGYDDRAIEKWARRIEKWSRGRRDIFLYFDNDAKVHAPFDALRLVRRLGLSERSS